MNRRKALKILGAIVCCLGAKSSFGENWFLDSEANITIDPHIPLDYLFDEEGIGDIIIRRMDGSRLVIPFTDIVDALK